MPVRPQQSIRHDHQENKALPQVPLYSIINKTATRTKTVEVRDSQDEPRRYGKQTLGEKQYSWKLLVSSVSSWSSSNFFPKEPSYHWKPKTLQWHILLPFVLVTLALIAVLEALSQAAGVGQNFMGNGPLVFAPTIDDIPASSSFAYLFFPTVVAVIYGMVWSWVDLDVKRLEPYFQLSKAGGAAAEESILLSYPFDFLALVPIKAGRRGHWLVFIAGTAMMMVFWIVTPVQSAIFTVTTVTRNRVFDMQTTNGLMDIGSQVLAIGEALHSTAYSVLWLGQKLPSYTTREYALLPFEPIGAESASGINEIWKASAVAYSVNISCSPAITTIHNSRYIFDNGNGCKSNLMSLPDANLQNASYLVHYMGYFHDAGTDYGLQGPNCTEENSDLFLALWASASSVKPDVTYDNATAIFCLPSYHYQLVDVQVNATDGAVIDISPQKSSHGGGETTGPLPDGMFNLTNFDYVVGVGTSSFAGTHYNQDHQDTILLEQYPRLANYSVVFGVANMAGFAISMNEKSVEEMSDPKVMERSFLKAYRLVFSLGFNALINQTALLPGQQIRQGVVQDQRGAIVIVRPVSIAIEAALLIVALMVCCLWYMVHKRESNLAGDPAAVTDIMSLVRNSRGILDYFKNAGTVSEADLMKAMSSCRFKIEAPRNGNPEDIRLEVVQDGQSSSNPQRLSAIPNPNLGRHNTETVWPLEMTLSIGAVLLGILIIGLAFLVFFFVWILQNNGIQRPSENSVVLSILENYLPTAFATFLEPFWVILTRLLCLLQPFDELRKGHARSSRSLEVKYTSLPPQLILLRAWTARHYVLFLTCAIAISTNVLAVSLSGLFTENTTNVEFSMFGQQNLASRFNGTPIQTYLASQGGSGFAIVYSDHFYVTFSNLTANTSMPSFTDKEFFYLPFTPTAQSTSDIKGNLDIAGYQATTIGLGLSPICRPLTAAGISKDNVIFETKQNGTTIQFITTHILDNGRNTSCISRKQKADNVDPNPLFAQPYLEHASSLEVVTNMFPVNTTDDADFCNSLMVFGWVRIGAVVPSNSPNFKNSTEGRSLDHSFIACTPRLLAGEFSIVVDHDNRIISSEQISDFSNNITSVLSPEHSTLLYSETSALLAPYSVEDFVWHNSTFTSDWFNSLLVASTSSRALLNTSIPLPAPADLISLITPVYRQLTAALLSLNPQLFAPADPGTLIPGKIMATQTRIFMSTPMFYLSVVLLCMHIIAAIIYYLYRPKRFLPRMPTTIASIIAYFAASQALRDFGPVGVGESERGNGRWGKRSEGEDEITYAYGRFIGRDGKVHVGIERQNLVVPLESRNPDVKRRRWGFRRKGDEGEPMTWI